LICSPQDLPFGEGIFCQSPHAVQLDNFVRVYFTTRLKDGPLNFKSFPAYVDYSSDFSTRLNFSSFPIMPSGDIGNFDEHGVFPFQPFFSSSGALMATTTGWSRRQSVPAESAIGLVASHDGGSSFEKVGIGPMLSALHDEPFLVADGYVVESGGAYNMFYIAGKKWLEKDGARERVYKIRHASSRDLVSWERTKTDLVESYLGENECQALPSVIRYNEVWLMAFCYRDAFNFRNNSESSYKIGWATSQDLVNWKREDNNHEIVPHESNWDREMQAYPNLFTNNEGTFMLYNGNQFGIGGFGIAQLMEGL